MDASRRVRELEAENARLRAEMAELRARVEKLQAALDEAQRAAKRQAAPFRKPDGPKPDPKKPGRKSGRRYGKRTKRAKPPRIDEHYDVPLPEACPHCGGRHLIESRTDTQYQTEIPRQPIYRQFDIHIGHCQQPLRFPDRFLPQGAVHG